MQTQRMSLTRKYQSKYNVSTQAYQVQQPSMLQNWMKILKWQDKQIFATQTLGCRVILLHMLAERCRTQNDKQAFFWPIKSQCMPKKALKKKTTKYPTQRDTTKFPHVNLTSFSIQHDRNNKALLLGGTNRQRNRE